MTSPAYKMSVDQLLMSAPLRGVALEAAAAFDPAKVASNRQVLTDPDSVDFLLAMIKKIPAAEAAGVVRAAVDLLDPERICSRLASDKRGRVREAALSVLTPEMVAETIAAHSSVAAPAFFSEIALPDEGLELLLTNNAENPFPATLMAAAAPQCAPELAAQAFLDANADDPKARWWAPMLAAHLILQRTEVLELLAAGEWASRPLEAVELAHLLCGPFSPEALAIVEPLLVREITAERLEAAELWDQRILFWYVASSPHCPAAVRDLAWSWAESAPAGAEFPSLDRRQLWFDDAAKLLMGHLAAGAAPLVSSPTGTTEPPVADLFRRAHAQRWGVDEWSLSADDWLIAAAAMKLAHWAAPQKMTGYQAIRILWIEQLLPLFSELVPEERMVSLREELTQAIPHRETPASLQLRLLASDPRSKRQAYYEPPLPDWIAESYEKVSSTLGDDPTAWSHLFELCSTARMSPIDAVAIVVD